MSYRPAGCYAGRLDRSGDGQAVMAVHNGAAALDAKIILSG
jgi:hypothetical protein